MSILRSLTGKSSSSKSSIPKPPRPAHHANDIGTAFQNPWDSATAPSWTELLYKKSFPLEWYRDGFTGHAKARKLDVVVPDWGKSACKLRGLQKEKCIVGTWLGHAAALVELPLPLPSGGKDGSTYFLFDPIFSYRAGPTQYTGPARFNKTPCTVADLPGCDVVFISHNHYDHLDATSIQALITRFPKTKFFVPLGNRTWLLQMGVPAPSIYELDWWDKREFSPLDFGREETGGGESEVLLRLTCVPAQHNSGRGALDKDSTLWCGWVIEQLTCSKDESKTSTEKRRGAIYHAGDTGYRRLANSDVVCPAFAEIGSKFGPFDLAFIPIWRGGTLGFFSNMGLRLSHQDLPAQYHASPRDAIAIHMDVKAKNTIGVHFGTFVGSDNEVLEAMIEFGEACDESGVGDLPGKGDVEGKEGRGCAGTIDIGASCAVELE